MNRALADLVFPIDESLPSEDHWLGYAGPALAIDIYEKKEIVLEYRIHDRNSNPRGRPFLEMTESIHRRHSAWGALLECKRLKLSTETRKRIQALQKAEIARYRGDLVSILLNSNLSIAERMAFSSMAHPMLYSLRSRYYRFLSGRQQR